MTKVTKYYVESRITGYLKWRPPNICIYMIYIKNFAEKNKKIYPLTPNPYSLRTFQIPEDIKKQK